MSGKIHDPNLLKNFKETTETDWYEVTAENFDIHGLIKDKEGSLSLKMPLDIAKTVSDGVFNQAIYGAGGRIFFHRFPPLFQ